ncbi:glycosyltransferase family 2 protein [Lutimaribacter sp. EGI FJ00015]|uniref:Glycosyltransferase family 2 protein n=1 Tax=Lutimaribacter degradans TaxID=2945989 RepID=A0ACC5ZT11_9RHOB|nr:glycosyltransferase family 2 protein [Lutimaribacter sp. EGI FJ00013]MCM2560960.1 glycosyltransferase family 2 protein [Lutimaribacter sp. EGI FJ00013]MCO0612094.1 glycosyltransferase family 2 protein [Lutimaribacter sp. EGI FJ00015]MCO0634786.1 glycosyltransferase family 2 protein [Lutimaribacter sp. EGI FJ00014]
MNFLAVLTVRNEAAFLLEWLAHHRAVGFTDFLVFSNDCQDGTDALLDRLDVMGLITHKRNDGPYDKRGIQFTALKAAEKLPIVRRANWIMALDVDEFVNIHAGDRTLPALLAALPEATAITLTWRLFGNGGVVHYTDAPVTRQFTRAAPVVMRWPWRAAMFKTLYRNDGTYRKLGVHRPRNPDPGKLPAARWFDGEGRALDDKFKTTRIFSNFGRSNYRLAQLNHYPLGAMESYVVKADRGRAVHSDHMLDVDYWVERNFSTDEDTSIQALDSGAELEMLKSDPELARLHNAAVAWRKARFDELMLHEPYRALFGRLLMTPPSRPVPAGAARFMIQYANKARDAQDG